MKSHTSLSAAPEGHRYFALVASLFVSTLLISNIAAQKLIPVGPFVFSGGILLFPITYIFGDALSEVYGYARTRQVIWMGFVASVMMAAFLAFIVYLPPAPGWPFQEAFETTLALVPRIVAGSLLGYWAGEFVNSAIMARLKVRTQGKALWLRTILSTMAGQAVDTVIVVLVAFSGQFPGSVLLSVIVSGYLFKVLYEIVATPLTYLIVKWLKRSEGVEVYDRTTSFNPFSLAIEGERERPEL